MTPVLTNNQIKHGNLKLKPQTKTSKGCECSGSLSESVAVLALVISHLLKPEVLPIWDT